MPGWVSIFFNETGPEVRQPAQHWSQHFCCFYLIVFLENSIYIYVYIYIIHCLYIYIYTHVTCIYIYMCVPSKQVNDLDKVCYDRSLASSKKDSGNHPQMSRRFNQTRQGKNHGKSTIYWLVVSNMAGLLSISYMGCHPKPIDKNIFERGR